MRKALLFSLALMLGAPTFAQDNVGDDCTKYIVNAGFDEDLTWNIDGSTKEIVDKSKNLSNRSQAWLAADSTGYAWGGISSKKRKDGGAFGWNGFAGRVKGWKFAKGGDNYNVGEWTYFGTAPYALKAKSVPIADDGDTYLEPPTTKPAEFDTDDNIGALYLRAGWGGWATYTQNVKVPVGKYNLTYWTYNANYAGSKDNKNAKNLTKIICRRDTVNDTEGFNSEGWTKHSIDITATDSLTIIFGYQSSGGSASNPFVWVDGIKLVKTDDVTREEVVASDIDMVISQLDELESSLMDYSGLVTEIESAKDAATDASFSEDLATLEAGYTAAAAAYERLSKVKDNIAAIQQLENKANKLREDNYPGLADLDAAISAAEDAISNGTSTDIANQVAALDKAIKDYVASKEASVDDPADYTLYVQNPWFIKDGLEPTVAADGTCTYPNAKKSDGTDNYVIGSGNDDFTSNGWYKGSVTKGDQRLNYAQGRSCWNAWATDFTELSINQDLTGLPNGYYTVSADLITQPDYVTDQHVFAKSSLEEAKSDPLTTGNWSNNNDGTWTTLTTTQKVLVHDGKLTIGAAGTGANGNQSGWFCVTNFKLNFVGKATQAEIDAAIAKKTAAADELVAGMHYAGDKANVQDSINAYKANGDLAVLNNGIALGNTSEAKYTEVMAEGKTIPTVQQNLSDANSYAPVHDVVAFAMEKTNSYLNSDTATYKQVDNKINALKRYANTYYDAAHKLDSVYNALTSKTAKEALENTLKDQKPILTQGDSIQNDSIVNALIGQLNAAVATAEAQELYEKNPSTTDYTGMIQNPDAAAETGWNINKGTGDGPIKSNGQYYTRPYDHNIFDSWNGTNGALNFYGDQKVVGLPNGTYTVSVYARTSGTGAYVFSANGTEKADTTWNEIPLQTFNWTHNNQGIGGDTRADGSDSILNATDKFGQVWADAIVAYKNDPTLDYLAGITAANNGNGFGWEKLTWTATVNNHELTIGMTTDSTRTGKAGFTGTWFSVVDWSLTLVQQGDNSGWFGPITGIKDVEKDNAVIKTDAIYTINGQRVNSAAQPGLYIVVKNGKARKVLVK